MTLHFDSLSDEDAWLVPDDITRKLIELDPNVITANGQPAPGDSVNLEFHATANQEFVYAGAYCKVRRPSHYSISQITLFRKMLADIHALPENHLPGEEMADSEVTWELTEVVKEANLPVEQTGEGSAVANRSDILALLHRKLGLQIIADHYSEWGSWDAATARPLKEILSRFETMRDCSTAEPCQAYSGFDGEFLYMRAKDVRLCNAREIPNRLLRPWQAAYARHGCLGLNELGEIALLSESQFPHANSNLMGIGDRPVTSPVLKLYGLLNARQRKEAFSGGTSVSAFTPAQREALTALLPTQKDSKPFEAVAVGIYKDGWRIDKDEPAPASAEATPVTVAMDDQTTSDEYHYEVKSGSGKSIKVISAKSAQEAWERITADAPDAKKENLILVKSRSIKATVRFADGSSCEKSVDIPARIPYSRAQESE